jgi:cell division septation protein DedD
MRGVFEDQEFEPAQLRRDTELMLGSGTLLLIFFGLVLVCGLCFGLGYAVGHHGQSSSLASQQPAAAAPTSLQSSGSVPKPSATAQTADTPAAETGTPPAESSPGISTDLPQSAASVAIPVPAAQTSTPAPPPSSQPQVRPALPVPVSLMVQIAAVANPDDADVLVNALRKRGYAVTVRREPADNLIHVRIGPFASRSVADQWRMKLLNDGYNAIIQ